MALNYSIQSEDLNYPRVCSITSYGFTFEFKSGRFSYLSTSYAGFGLSKSLRLFKSEWLFRGLSS
jgi:hypothetical protein